MNKIAFSIALTCAAPLALAQNCFDTNYGVSLGGGADVVKPIQAIGFPFAIGNTTYTDCHISDHGIIYLSNGGVPAPPLTGNAVLYTPTLANFQAGSPKICCLYADIVASGAGGDILINSSATKCTITWRNVNNFGIAPPQYDMQAVLQPGGIVTFRWAPSATNVSTFGVPSDNGIVGIHPGGGAGVPPNANLSASPTVIGFDSIYELWTVPNTFDLQNNSLLLVPAAAASPTGYTAAVLGAPANCASAIAYGAGCNSLGLAVVGLPTIGNLAFSLNVSGANFVALIAWGTVGIPAPGVPLPAPLFATGCVALQNANIGLLGTGPLVGGVGNFPLPIPPATLRTQLFAQGVSFNLTGALTTSNACAINVGF
ncbi:MAG: hypothetical protein ABIP94_12935 [Planctomycetota bacterium]